MANITLKSPADIEKMRAACRLAAQTLEETAKILRVGMTTEEINTFVHEYTLAHHATPATLGYRGYPKSVCTSVNEVICHGIPGKQVLQDGDIINIDITSILDGWYGDVSATFYIGTPSPAAKNLVETTRECLQRGIDVVSPKARLEDIGAAIQAHAEGRGFSVVREFVGHGIGRNFHEAPQVLHVGRKGRGIRLLPGMIFTIEPMINQGMWQARILDDDWTAVTADGKLSAQFEHTILVTDTGCEVLTAFAAPLANSEIF
ncbi:MAG: type I methionyl aminopeptidase [Myxococcales bacterium]|jgi:methionyl aminopeptidase|nr:type I methionyl aminopeptidase [Myxococcales bacterium]